MYLLLKFDPSPAPGYRNFSLEINPDRRCTKGNDDFFSIENGVLSEHEGGLEKSGEYGLTTL